MLTFTVTEDHVTRGQANSCSFCPAALAIAEATGRCPVEVDVGRIAIRLRYPDAEFNVGTDLGEAINSFDAGKPDAFGKLPRTFRCDVWNFQFLG
jgi:hypothetical protein